MNKLAITLIIMIVLSLLFSGLNIHANGSGENLVGYWRFDEGSGTTASDSSGNGNTGTLHSGAAWTDGKFAKALDFNGVDGYVQIPQSSSLDVSAQVTVEAWVNLRAYVDSTGMNSHIVSRSDNMGSPYYVLATFVNGSINYDIGPFSGYHSSVATLPLNSWTHLAMTYDGASVCLYINGVADSNYAQSGSIPTTSNWLAIGCKPTAPYGGPGTYAYTNGIIDDVRIYNRALNQQEIQDEMGVPRGPRMNTLNIKYYNGPNDVYTALKNGTVDLTDIGLTQTQMQDAFNDTNLKTSVSPENFMYEFDFNNNSTTPTYPGWTSPTAYKGFRQGIACLVDKTQFANLCNYSTRTDTPVPRPIGDFWVDWNVSQYDSYGNLLGNYPYEYNSNASAQFFDQSGFVQGNTSNPYYDGEFPGSAQFLRVYPLGHPKVGQNLDPLIFIIRNDDPIRLQVGETLKDRIRKMGIPVNATELPLSAARTQVITNRNYNIYTGAWFADETSWLEPDSQFPVSLLDLYSSQYIYSGGGNYQQFRNSTYDGLCEELDYPPDLGLARSAAVSCQQILIQEAVSVWLCSPGQVMAYRNVSGVTDLKGGRIDNQWTFLRAYGSNNASTEINYGLWNAPLSLNVITDNSPITSDCLGRIYDTLLSYCPYDETPGNVYEEGDRGGTMPWLAREWDIGAWASPYIPGDNLTKLTFHLREGVRWHDGVQLNSTDVEFTIEYLKSLGAITQLQPYVSDVDHVTTPDAYTVFVYENVSSVRTLDSIGKLPILPKHVFQSITNVTGYTPGADAGYPANQTLIGCGPWKYVFHNSSMLRLEANRDYFMETTPAAEIDFRYDWKLGCWVVDAMDLTMLKSAYGSNGSKVGGPDENWEPGCDLDGDGRVGLGDLVIITNGFNETWGASAIRAVAEPPDCVVDIDPEQSSVLLGQNLTAYVKFRNVNRLSGFQFKLNYDNTMLNCLNLDLSPTFSAATKIVNQTTGLIWVYFGSALQVNGNVTAATITFNTTQSGSSAPHLWDTELARYGALGSTCQPIPHRAIDASIAIGVSTPTGTNVSVRPAQNVTVTFNSVTTQGLTTLEPTQPPTDQFVSVVCDNITTNATYTGNVTVQFNYDPSGRSLKDQQAMKIWLWVEPNWTDITTSVNTTSHTIYGLSPHLSMFGVTSDLGLTGDLSVDGTTILSIPPTPPSMPNNLVGLNYYQINTSKILPTPINVSLAYNFQGVASVEEVFAQMWVWSDTAGGWTDVTTSVNTTSHMVYGTVPHLSMFGVTSLPQPPVGVTVASAICPKTVVCQGYSANINVTICNQGDFPQKNFDVALYCNTTMLPTLYHVGELDPNHQEILNFTWSTNGGWAIGNYCISALSQCIRWVEVARVGDVSMDNKVDGRDLLILSRAFGSYGPDYFYPGSPATLGWNPNADITNDNKVDGRDLLIASRHFGEGT
jgi:ABC-type transport system substrate-binding protein